MLMPFKPAEEPVVLILSGDTDGYLAPCGCSKPMSGGIRRRVEAAKSLSGPGKTLLLDNGNLVDGTARQDEIKAETMAQVLGTAGWTAINLGPSDAALGRGSLLSLQQLSKGKFIASSLEDSELPRWAVEPPFLVIGVTTEPEALSQPLVSSSLSLEETLSQGVAEAEAQGLVPIVLLQGGAEKAAEIARNFPAVKLVQFRAAGSPLSEPERVGETWLVTPGEKGKHLLRLEFENGKFTSYSAVNLGPAFEDDPVTARLYMSYLARVRDERLLDKLPREASAGFAGTAACISCHTAAGDVWKSSAHATALKTLEDDHHDADPDCVSCHVVGLEKKGGFQSKEHTPELANVGCESCHGAGNQHASDPLKIKMGSVGERSCAPCHVPDHSPGFDFKKYWETVRH